MDTLYAQEETNIFKNLIIYMEKLINDNYVIILKDEENCDTNIQIPIELFDLFLSKFNNDLINKHSSNYDIFYNNDVYNLNLNCNDEDFEIEVLLNNNFFHEFEILNCDYEIWNNIILNYNSEK